MTDPSLQINLLAFMLVATWLIIFWNQFRKVIRIPTPTITIEKKPEHSQLNRSGLLFWIIFSLFGVMTLVYSLVPEYYYIFFPLDTFHHPVINIMGLLIMKIAIIWIVIAQVHIDKELYKYSRNIESLSAIELVRYSERMLLAGKLVLFIGLFITITNIISLILVALGVGIYLKMSLTSPPHHFQK